MNRTYLMGNLTKDVEVRSTPSGQTVANFGIATNKKWTTKDGVAKEKATFHNIVCWGKSGEACANSLSKGSKVFIEGEIDNRSYEDKEGNKKYISEVIASSVQFISTKPVSENGQLPGQGEVKW